MSSSDETGEQSVKGAASGRGELAARLGALRGSDPVEWIIEDTPVAYGDAVSAMERRVAAIADGAAPEAVWLLEHPPLYTAGTSADVRDLTDPNRFPVFQTGRGGQYTYHGPGQRVGYVMLDLTRRGRDVRLFVSGLEDWLIRTLGHFTITGERREDRVGVWVRRPERGPGAEAKVAALGIRLRRWVTFHGISFNVDPDLDHFSGIVPCGVAEHSVTSLAELGHVVSMAEADSALRTAFEDVFGPTFRSQAVSLISNGPETGSALEMI